MVGPGTETGIVSMNLEESQVYRFFLMGGTLSEVEKYLTPLCLALRILKTCHTGAGAKEHTI